MRALVLICLIAIALQPACLTTPTTKVFEKSEELPLESARVDVVLAAPYEIVPRSETTCQGYPM